VHFGLLPAVYYPSFRLNFFCIEKENNNLVITYVEVPKTPERELTWLQRLVTLGKAPKSSEAVPARTVIDFLQCYATAAVVHFGLNATPPRGAGWGVAGDARPSLGRR